MSNFRDQINKAKDKVDRITTTTQKQIAFETQANLIQITPVDTSRAKSNWWMDVNTVSLVEIEPDNGTAATLQGMSVLQRDIKIDDTIYISNNLPYIQRLNEGHSSKADPGFVEGSIQIAKAKVKSIARGVK